MTRFDYYLSRRRFEAATLHNRVLYESLAVDTKAAPAAPPRRRAATAAASASAAPSAGNRRQDSNCARVSEKRPYVCEERNLLEKNRRMRCLSSPSTDLIVNNGFGNGETNGQNTMNANEEERQ